MAIPQAQPTASDDEAIQQKLESIAEQILPLRASYEWNQALMDLGAMVCTSRSPSCHTCPVSSHCLSSGKMSRIHQVSRRIEPSFRRIPNRIYRGKIIDHLRGHPEGRKVRIDYLGKTIVPGLRKKDQAWFFSVIRSLEKDGLVRVKESNKSEPTSVILA